MAATMKKRTLVVLLAAVIMIEALLPGCAREETSEDKTILTIACWIKDFPLSLYVDEFNNRNSDYEIQIFEYYDPTEQDFEEAMTRMRIDLIVNNRCDLLYLDSMDIYALENAGLLMDLLPLMEEDTQFQTEEYYWNIWSLYQRSGKLYEWIPAFELTGVYGPSMLLSDIEAWTIEEYRDFTESTGQRVGAITPTTMICSMLQYSNHDLISLENGTCHLDSEEFMEWLKFAGEFESGNGSLRLHWIRGMMDYLSEQQMFETPVCLVNVPVSQRNSICASAHFSFGISSKTEHTDICWDFLEFLMDDDMLNQVTSGFEWVGFPMKKDLLISQLDCAMLPASDPDSLVHNWGEDAIPIKEPDAARLLHQIETIDCVQKRIMAVLNIVIDESAAYFSGDKTIEETASLIQSRSSIYLSEQQQG